MAETENTFDFELVSPEKKLASVQAWQVVVPGEEGDFGVLSGHSALVASIRPGVVRIWEEKGAEPHNIFITGGFADVNPESCTVLAEEAVMVEDLDQEAIEQKLRDLNEDLGMAENDIERARVRKQIVLEKARLQAVTGRLVA